MRTYLTRNDQFHKNFILTAMLKFRLKVNIRTTLRIYIYLLTKFIVSLLHPRFASF